MPNFLATLNFSLSVTFPIFVVMALGFWLRRCQLINDNFIDISSKLTFNITLPALLFISVTKTQADSSSNLKLILFGLGVTLIVFLLLEYLSKILIQEKVNRGVVVQGGFRANMGIVGLAYCINAFGDQGLKASSLYMALLTIQFNILAVITLNRSLQKSASCASNLKHIAKNPIIIGVLLALPFAIFSIPLPGLALHTGEYLAQMTLPLALLCIGASLDLKALRLDKHNALLSSAAKLLLVPSLFLSMALACGFRGIELGVIVLMASSPTAAASYMMTKAMGGNAPLAANIIVLTTLGSLITSSLTLFVLRNFALI